MRNSFICLRPLNSDPNRWRLLVISCPPLIQTFYPKKLPARDWICMTNISLKPISFSRVISRAIPNRFFFSDTKILWVTLWFFFHERWLDNGWNRVGDEIVREILTMTVIWASKCWREDVNEAIESHLPPFTPPQ